MNSMTETEHSCPLFGADPIKWALPAILKNCEQGLGAVSVANLQKCLQPVLDGLKRIDATDLLNLEKVPDGQGPCVSDGFCVRPIHDLIMPPCEEGTVRYIHLSEVEDQYSMGVFVFPPNSKIPLHDHPGMCVLSRVLYGDLRRKSLDLARTKKPVQEDNVNANGKSWLSWKKSRIGTKRQRHGSELPKGSKLAYRNRIDQLAAPDCTILYPYEGNLHEFTAGPQGAAVLDVLLPPYDHKHHRDCTFYEIKECTREEQLDSNLDPVWIIPTGQPEDFHCISGTYERLD